MEKRSREARDEVRRGKERRLWFGGRAIATAVLILIGFAITSRPMPADVGIGTEPGQRAPAFMIMDVDDRSFSLAGQRGRVVLLDFMGSRCDSCIVEMPHLARTAEAFRNRNFIMISIDIGGPLGTEDPAVARAFLADHEGVWQIALDNQQLDAAYRVRGPPTIVVVDSGGIVRMHHAGVQTSNALIPFVEQFL